MININPPKIEGKTIYETLRYLKQEDMDFCDKDWDFGVNMSCEDTLEECRDNYDKFMFILCLNIVCIKTNLKFYSVADFVSFFESNKSAIDRFLNEENREGFRPMDYEKLDPTEDSGYYEVYFCSFENLINGNYCESNYEKLNKLLLGEIE